MKRSAICKLSIACAVFCGIIGGISIAPVVVAAIFALVALICLFGCVIVFIAAIFVWLFSIGQANIFNYASMLADWGLGLFNFIGPVAKFSFTYITPISGWIAIGIGVLGIILSSVGISIAKKQSSQTELQSNSLGANTVTVSDDGTQEADTAKKKKVKKKKSDKAACTASLVVCIVFSVVAVIAMLVASLAITLF